MKLFLHAGTEKTGSSHIQTLCVNGRKHLEQEGIWFPEGIPRHEKRMRAGLVSAGNAFVMAERVRVNDDAGALAELVRHRKTAQSRNCRAVFLTSELLLPYCANDDAWLGLFENCRRAGFDSVSTLVVLRDPVEQLISLYKHRAKSGKAGRLDEWIAEGYHLPETLAHLRGQAGVAGRELIARGYTREPGGLERILFDNWLGVSEPPHVHENEVNPSLSLSELELIRQLHRHQSALVPFMHERLTVLPREHKAPEDALQDHARALAAREAWRNRDEWRRWNELLPQAEALSLPATMPDCPEWPDELGFSTRQIEELAQCMAHIARPGSLVSMVWRSSLKPALSSARRVFFRRR